MKEIFDKIKIPLIVMAVLIAGFILYKTLGSKPEQKSLLASTSQATTSSPEKDFLPLLLSIQGVTLDQKIFLDPVFRALVDWSQQIVPESIGRQNPFSGVLSGTVNSSVESLGFRENTSSQSRTPAR